jgi:uncharacterized protein YjiS (DUF1127 family)
MHSEPCVDTIRPRGHRALPVDVAAVIWFALRRLGFHFSRGVELLQLWSERKSQRYQLAELNEQMLRDIGLSRADVMAEATKPFWRP